jgi:hypothetical protein
MFCDDFEFKLVCFYDPRKLIHVLYVTGANCIFFLLSALSPVLHSTLRPTLCPAQKRWVVWRLWYWRPMMDESETWVFLVLIPSSYWALENSFWVVMLGNYWLASFRQLGHHWCNLLFLEEIRPSSGRPLGL